MATFLKLHHGFLEHEKHAELSNDALLLHISGLMHASRELTDGRLTKSPMVRISWSARLVAAGADVDALIAELVDEGVWEDWPSHYQIVNFAEHNRTKAQVDAVREADRRRKRTQRERISEPSDADTDPDTEVPVDSGAESRRDTTRDTTTNLSVVANGPNPWTPLRRGTA